MSTNTIGEYSTFSTQLSKEAKQAFAEAVERFSGVKYEPLAAASRVVAGTMYAFFCNASVVVPDAASFPAMLVVFKPPQGPAVLTHVEKLPY